jgi:hypothetical protein
MLYPPVGIAHVSSNLMDFTNGNGDLPRVNRVVIGSAAQPNSAPHVGTVTTTFCAFAIGQLAEERYGVPTSVMFDTLDNAPAPEAHQDGGQFQLSLDSVPAPDGAGTLADYNFRSYERVLDWAHDISGVPWERRTYTEFQASLAIRRRALGMASNAQRFGRMTSPASGRLHLRVRCPTCGLLDKTTALTTIRSTDGGSLTIASSCPHHGDFGSPLNFRDPTYLDLNTPMRDIAKCGEFIDWRSQGTLVVMVDGGDWGGSWAWEVVMRALAWLGEDLRAAPTRLFAPVILDETGAKLSKSLYVGSDAYNHLPAWIMNPAAETGVGFHTAMSRLWEMVCDWVGSPSRFFRNYALNAIM